MRRLETPEHHATFEASSTSSASGCARAGDGVSVWVGRAKHPAIPRCRCDDAAVRVDSEATVG
jgi:hypothetical protein